jgi:hypothetical protein
VLPPAPGGTVVSLGALPPVPGSPRDGSSLGAVLAAEQLATRRQTTVSPMCSTILILPSYLVSERIKIHFGKI